MMCPLWWVKSGRYFTSQGQPGSLRQTASWFLFSTSRIVRLWKVAWVSIALNSHSPLKRGTLRKACSIWLIALMGALLLNHDSERRVETSEMKSKCNWKDQMHWCKKKRVLIRVTHTSQNKNKQNPPKQKQPSVLVDWAWDLQECDVTIE